MSTSNYCAKIWEAYNAATAVEPRAKDALVYFGQSGQGLEMAKAKLADLAGTLDNLQETWDKSFETLPDGRKLFGPEYEAIERITDGVNGLKKDSEKEYLGKFVQISDEGYVYRFHTLLRVTLNSLEDVKYFSHLKYAVDLRLSPNVDFSSLSVLPYLDSVGIKFEEDFDVSKLDIVPKLDFLELKAPVLKNIQALSRQTDLTSLKLSGQLDTLDFINQMPELESVDICNCINLDINILKNNPNITILNLTGSTIIDFSPIGTMENLDELVLDDTNLDNLSVMKNLKNLNILYIDNTQVIDLSPLLKCENLMYINIVDTPALDDPWQKVIIKLLEARGVQVNTEPI